MSATVDDKSPTGSFLDRFRREAGNPLKDDGNIPKDWCLQCFIHYDKNKDGYLDSDEFTNMLRDIFPDSNSRVVSLSDELLKHLDEDEDGRLGKDEHRWQVWLSRTLRPVSALLIIDVQNDFIDGTLSLKTCPAGQDGAAVIPVINKLSKTIDFDLVAYSLDWHDDRHISFLDNIHLRALDNNETRSIKDIKLYDEVVFSMHAPHSQIMWPRHCVRETWGAKLHEDLYVTPDSVQVYKGTDTDVDSYSAFFDNNRASQTKLFSILQSHNVSDVYVCGIAYDVCVKYTASDAIYLGFRTHLIDDACRGVKLDDIELTKKDLMHNGCCILKSHQVSEWITQKNQDIDRALWIARALANSV
ncbi:uncharacterized protein LOC106869615 [Argonauta hians]